MLLLATPRRQRTTRSLSSTHTSHPGPHYEEDTLERRVTPTNLVAQWRIRSNAVESVSLRSSAFGSTPTSTTTTHHYDSLKINKDEDK
ncbi:hypothetical protein Hypma_013583 [Hypsizygus marmoreus]|uniref:Uncharacterized protein n=1 Tax=Hypsizygus marmoreus TaxID=39966 RepID=A0A369JBH3_HYPMA|nr:hypothetical protein Hypma_013583 [Hypsizygus marmoreus]